MNGSVSLIKTLVNSGVEVCFTNPGTSEMHFVAAPEANGAQFDKVWRGQVYALKGQYPYSSEAAS